MELYPIRLSFVEHHQPAVEAVGLQRTGEVVEGHLVVEGHAHQEVEEGEMGLLKSRQMEEEEEVVVVVVMEVKYVS